MKFHVLIGVLLMAGSGITAASAAELIKNGEHAVGEQQAVSLKADVADISVAGTDGNTIEWRLELQSEASDFLFWDSEGLSVDALQRIEVTVETRGDTLVLTPVIPEEYEDENININWFVRVPRQLHVVVETDVGDVDITEMNSGLEAKTDVGDVEIEQLRGTVDVATDVGDITIRNLEGDATVQSDVGDVDIHDVTGKMNVQNDVGDVEITLPAARLELLDLTTDTGDIDVEVAGKKIPAHYPEYGPGAELRQSFDGQGSRIDAHTDVGDIEITGK